MEKERPKNIEDEDENTSTPHVSGKITIQGEFAGSEEFAEGSTLQEVLAAIARKHQLQNIERYLIVLNGREYTHEEAKKIIITANFSLVLTTNIVGGTNPR